MKRKRASRRPGFHGDKGMPWHARGKSRINGGRDVLPPRGMPLLIGSLARLLVMAWLVLVLFAIPLAALFGCTWTTYRGVEHKTFLTRTSFVVAPRDGESSATITSDADHAIDSMEKAPGWVRDLVRDEVSRRSVTDGAVIGATRPSNPEGGANQGSQGEGR